MHAVEMPAPAAKLLLTCCDHNKSAASAPINVSAQTSNGSTLLGGAQGSIGRVECQLDFAKRGVALSDEGWSSTDQRACLLEQLREVEALLVLKGTIDNSWKSSSHPSCNGDHDEAKRSFALPCDAGRLLGKGLFGLTSRLPGRRDVGSSLFIRDDIARQLEIVQKKSHLCSSQGAHPKAGQKLQLPCALGGLGGCLVGEITEAFPAPTKSQLR